MPAPLSTFLPPASFTAGLLLACATLAGAEDPRIPLVRSQMEGQPRAALAEVERLISQDPELARGLGLEYLRARLLATLGETEAANQALLQVISESPAFSSFSYYQMALTQEQMGHPETAAGLIAKVVALGGDFPALDEATRLLTRTLVKGGDCRLLGGIKEQTLVRRDRRQVQLARIVCALRLGDAPRARLAVLTLLRESRADEAALEAAELAAARLGTRPDRELDYEIGLTLHEHRDFARSSQYLDRAGSRGSGPTLDPDEATRLYARSRNDFWLGSYRAAADGFGRLAERLASSERRADALYQQGRSLELASDWAAAAAIFRRTYSVDPRSEWGALGLLSALRIEWRQGSEATALALYDLLLGTRQARDQAGRAALFLAVSDLVQGRADRAGAWLSQSEVAEAASAVELAYWRGRLAELAGDKGQAVALFLQALRLDPYHPFALAARERLSAPALASVARDTAQRLAASGQTEDLRSAWLLFGDGGPRSAQVLASFALRLTRDPFAAAYLRLAGTPIESWVLWQRPLLQPQERLLSLGLWQEGAGAVQRFFPPAVPELAFTASRQLARVGELRQAVLLAEILDQRRPSNVPARLLPAAFRELLYPLGYRDTLLAAAQQRRIDPWLLAAIIREESRYDSRALSDASARGLTQFTQQTARRFAAEIGRTDVTAADLYQPAIAIALGAAYLAHLEEDFAGADPAVVAAYNAGEDQARLWQSYCYSRDPAEYYSKVGFKQTRAYLIKVLSSRAQYREIYGRNAG